jgi:hypothetical protein
VIVIIKEEKSKIKKINLHDAEIAKVICDYDKGIVEMPIIMAEKHLYAAILRFENISYVEVNRMEPWGPGINISAVSVEDADGNYFRVSILLNSGDEVNIITSKMIYSANE